MPTPFKLCPSRFRLFSVIFQCFLQVENLLAVVDDAVRDVACDGTRHVAVRHVAAWHVAARRETQCVTGMTRHSFLAISAHVGFRFFNSHEKQKNKIMHCLFVYPVIKQVEHNSGLLFCVHYDHRLYKISGHNHHDVTHWFVDYHFEASSLAFFF